MADATGIEWTEATWNPTTGCDRTSPGCDHCYALTLSKRLKAMGQPKYQADGDPRTSGPGFGLTLHPDTLDVPRTWSTPRYIFVNSMSDLFHEDVPLDYIRQVFEMMAATPQHTYQVLTKRRSASPAMPARSTGRPTSGWASRSRASATPSGPTAPRGPGRVRFVSAEPLLGPISFDLDSIDWMIVGGESGPKARPMDPAWVEQIRDDCLAAGVAFFFKQWGGRTPKTNGRELDGRAWDEMPKEPAIA